MGSSRSKKPRLGGKRHGDFELALLAMAELVDLHGAAGLKSDLGERFQRRLAQGVIAPRVLPELERVAGVRLHGERDIVERAEAAEQRGDLERAGDAKQAAAVDGQRGDVASVERDACRLAA